MPKVKSLSEFNRNQASIINELEETQEPLYLTRNGNASIVVMDSEAFDRAMSYRTSAYANEMRVYNSLMEGYADYVSGNIVDAESAEKDILDSRGWA